MRNAKTFFILAFLILIGAREAQSQSMSLQLIINEPLPALDFAGFVISNDLTNTPEVFRVIIFPEGQRVYLKGLMQWQDVGTTGWRQLVSFTTNVFTSRTFTNRQLGTGDLRVQDSEVNTAAIEDNLAKGKPVGEYRLYLEVWLENGTAPAASAEKYMTFFNPSQTLSLMSPLQGTSYDPGTVIATWTSLTGVTNYKIRANVRTNPSQSLEDALAQGNPLINDKDVGNVTTANLRPLLDREWQGGQEVVVQVFANIPGPAGGSNVFSPVVNFYINAPNNTQQQALNAALQQIVAQLPPAILNQLGPYLTNANLQLTGILKEDGSMLTTAELTAIFAYLQTHPENIVNIIVTPNN